MIAQATQVLFVHSKGQGSNLGTCI